MTIQQIFDAILGQAGVIVVLIIILWAGWQKIWVFGWYATELRERNDKLETRLDRALGAAENGTGLANRAVRQVEERSSGQPG